VLVPRRAAPRCSLAPLQLCSSGLASLRYRAYPPSPRPSPLASQLHPCSGSFDSCGDYGRQSQVDPCSEGNDRRRDRSLIDVEICIRSLFRCRADKNSGRPIVFRFLRGGISPARRIPRPAILVKRARRKEHSPTSRLLSTVFPLFCSPFSPFPLASKFSFAPLALCETPSLIAGRSRGNARPATANGSRLLNVPRIVFIV